MTTAHSLYDMIARPEYLEPLREEIKQVMEEDGGWQKTTISKMRKMDSFVKEAQRMSPASALGFHRIVQNKPVTLSDGIVLPPSMHLCGASEQILKDKTWADNVKQWICDSSDPKIQKPASALLAEE
ncbi:hypothetical protein GJ744_011293 [Endocarpon pusillum]|uniref:Uncharacterized protein n=1 Tax=Endocarpon pusillum TaxID=364733 RepID=A0A8H7E8D4_9EURO|nr:hypothetical protein GJ744_011293 [Endocarpon pusillum]